MLLLLFVDLKFMRWIQIKGLSKCSVFVVRFAHNCNYSYCYIITNKRTNERTSEYKNKCFRYS